MLSTHRARGDACLCADHVCVMSRRGSSRVVRDAFKHAMRMQNAMRESSSASHANPLLSRFAGDQSRCAYALCLRGSMSVVHESATRALAITMQVEIDEKFEHVSRCTSPCAQVCANDARTLRKKNGRPKAAMGDRVMSRCLSAHHFRHELRSRLEKAAHRVARHRLP
jgi:hypothetical protein